MWMWNQCDHRVYVLWQCCNKQKTQSSESLKDETRLLLLWVSSLYIICIYIHILYCIIYMYIYIYIKLDNRIFSNTIIYSYTVNVNLVLNYLSELIIYCKYASKFSVFEVIYYIFLCYTFLPIHSSLTYKRHMSDTTSLKIMVSAINL